MTTARRIGALALVLIAILCAGMALSYAAKRQHQDAAVEQIINESATAAEHHYTGPAISSLPTSTPADHDATLAPPDPQTFAPVHSDSAAGPQSPADSPDWQHMTRTPDPAAATHLPSQVLDAWACDDQQIDTTWQLTRDQAARLTGPAVILPSVCTVAPTTSSDMTDAGLALPPAPWATWYLQSAPIGAASGNTIFAGHLGYPDGQTWTPFRGLSRLEPGAPVIVRTADGTLHLYEATTSARMDWADLPTTPGMFDNTGAPRLTLVTCMPGLHRNVVITATPVN